MAGLTQKTESAYQAWRAANKRYRLEDDRSVDVPSDAATDAESKAWDEFRDLCEQENPHGDCSHPECPA